MREVIGPPFEIGLPRLGVTDGDLGRVVAAYRERYEDLGLFENELYPGHDSGHRPAPGRGVHGDDRAAAG